MKIESAEVTKEEAQHALDILKPIVDKTNELTNETVEPEDYVKSKLEYLKLDERYELKAELQKEFPLTPEKLEQLSENIYREDSNLMLMDLFGIAGTTSSAGYIYLEDLVEKEGFRFYVQNVYHPHNMSGHYHASGVEKHLAAKTRMQNFNGSILIHPSKKIFARIDNCHLITYKTENACNVRNEAGEIEREIKTNYGYQGYHFTFGYADESAYKELMSILDRCDIYTQTPTSYDSGRVGIFAAVPGGGCRVHTSKLKADPKLDLTKFYNDDFEPVNKVIMDALATPNSKGVVLLHGLRGTGKTSYIKWLTTQSDIIEKQFIYMPLDLIYKLADPDFISFIMQNSNAIIIIEDGEKVIEKRSTQGNNAVSNILNFSDGIMSDVVNLQFIITFNTHISTIDDALLRKGRLIAEYEFKPLAVDKCKALIKEEYRDEITTPMALSEALYYKSETGIRTEDATKKAVGFGK